MSKKAIWIDLDNSPHVPLFIPVIKNYRLCSQPVIVTARDFAQTLELLDKSGFCGEYEVIGKHQGKNKIKKLVGLFYRAFELVEHIKELQKRGLEIGVALSHGSRSMVLAARWLNIPIITMYDYEYTETFIFNHFSTKVLIPDRIPDSTLDTLNLSPSKRVKYVGYKEELYLRHYEADDQFLEIVSKENSIFIDQSKVIVTLRPPATSANYHNEESELLLFHLLETLLLRTDTFTFILPRTNEQKLLIESFILQKTFPREAYLIPQKAVNGLDLAFHSDLLISGGGTMNREAALLGIPVYSIFAGKQGALDKDMEERGMIHFVRKEADLQKIVIQKKKQRHFNSLLSDNLEKCLRGEIEKLIYST